MQKRKRDNEMYRRRNKQLVGDLEIKLPEAARDSYGNAKFVWKVSRIRLEDVVKASARTVSQHGFAPQARTTSE